MLAFLLAIMCNLALPIIAHEILVLPLKNLPDKLRTGDVNPLRVKQYEFSLLDETFVFPQSKLLPTTSHVMNWNMSRSHICSLAKQPCRRQF